jgi:hypothetical protein
VQRLLRQLYDRSGMASDLARRPALPLVPRGRDVAEDAVRLLARSTGRLMGAPEGDAVRTWLEQEGGQRVVLMWPAAFRARLAPVEVLDEHGAVVARAGDVVTVGGGYLKDVEASPRDEPIFVASSAPTIET